MSTELKKFGSALVQTLATPTLDVVDCLAAGQLLLRMARDRRTPEGDRELAKRVGAQMVAAADLELAMVATAVRNVPAAPRGHGRYTVEATGDGVIRCQCGKRFATDLSFRDHLAAERGPRQVRA